MAGQSTPARTLLSRNGVRYRLHTYTPDPRASSYGAEATEALGLAPLGHRKRLTVVIDVSVRDHETVFCSAGRRGLQLELAPDSLVQATVAPIASPG
jgi:prolyl-tRNA editing enzyme YbaK/EbsC (Cys-tRNA(Pro) deacylase)